MCLKTGGWAGWCVSFSAARAAPRDVAARAEIKRAFDTLYRSGKNVSQALAASSEAEWSEVGRTFWDFVASAKKRGLCDWLGGRRDAGGSTAEPV